MCLTKGRGLLNLLGQPVSHGQHRWAEGQAGSPRAGGTVTMALTVCVKHLAGLPGIHDRQVRLCFRGETCMDGLSLFRIGEFPRPPTSPWLLLLYLLLFFKCERGTRQWGRLMIVCMCRGDKSLALFLNRLYPENKENSLWPRSRRG